MYKILIFIMLTAGATSACEKESPNNPFTNEGEGNGMEGNQDPVALSYAGLPGLQDQLFKPTCANSGCHDSTFEPDFRTLGSTYATLVNQPVLKNDDAGTYDLRVVPSDTGSSQLLARLQYDIDGNSGVMPLVTEPDSRYDAQKDTLLRYVRRWILEGAKISE